MGLQIIATTIHLSLICYLLAVICWVSKRRGPVYRGWWTGGCALLWLHVLAAYQFHHHWSHAAAVADTAAQTEALLGVRFGAGIWFNYVLMALWTIDVVCEWRQSTAERSRPRWLSRIVHAFALFIIFNGTVVFKEGAIRFAGLVGVIWVGWMAWRFRGVPARPSLDHGANA